MSLSSWKEEYYPVTAKLTSEKDALDYSIRKWEGLQKAAMKKHGVEVMFDSGAYLVEAPHYRFEGGGSLRLGESSCALCTHHLTREGARVDDDGIELTCESCPLAQSREGIPCDQSKTGEVPDPWASFYYGDPKPMLVALRAAKRRAENASTK